MAIIKTSIFFQRLFHKVCAGVEDVAVLLIVSTCRAGNGADKKYLF